MKTTKKEINENTTCSGQNFAPKSFCCCLGSRSFDYNPSGGQIIEFNHSTGEEKVVLESYYLNKSNFISALYSYLNN